MTQNKDFERIITLGYSLTTAEILYHLPDHPALLQSYVWQEYDLAPKFPTLNRFLDFWVSKIEGKLHSVTICHKELVRPADLQFCNGEFRIH